MKKTDAQQVAEFMNNLEHPLKAEIAEVRNYIIKANEHITEHIKWNAPSFCFNNEDRVTFNFHGKDYFMLIFHCGAKPKSVKAVDRLIDDTTGLLDWITNDRATVKFMNMNDVMSKRVALNELINKWLEVS